MTALKLVNDQYSGLSNLAAHQYSRSTYGRKHTTGHLGKSGSAAHHGSLATLVDIPFGNERDEAYAAGDWWPQLH